MVIGRRRIPKTYSKPITVAIKFITLKRGTLCNDGTANQELRVKINHRRSSYALIHIQSDVVLTILIENATGERACIFPIPCLNSRRQIGIEVSSLMHLVTVALMQSNELKTP